MPLPTPIGMTRITSHPDWARRDSDFGGQTSIRWKRRELISVLDILLFILARPMQMAT